MMLLQSGDGREQRPHELAAILESLGFVLAAEVELPSAKCSGKCSNFYPALTLTTLCEEHLALAIP